MTPRPSVGTGSILLQQAVIRSILHIWCHYGGVNRPDWHDSRISGRKRVALWLVSEVGEGGVFTKQLMRAALSSSDKQEQDEQIDRRMRDLRDEGWVISTRREDAGLNLNELRLVTVGGYVWEQGYRSKRAGTPTAKERQTTLAADDYRCRICGVGAGEPYPEDPLRAATLSISRTPGGLVTCCARCLNGEPAQIDYTDLLRRAECLSDSELGELRSWIRAGQRQADALTKIWSAYGRLPQAQRSSFEAEIASLTGIREPPSAP